MKREGSLEVLQYIMKKMLNLAEDGDVDFNVDMDEHLAVAWAGKKKEGERMKAIEALLSWKEKEVKVTQDRKVGMWKDAHEALVFIMEEHPEVFFEMAIR